MSVNIAELSRNEGRISEDYDREEELDRLLTAGGNTERDMTREDQHIRDAGDLKPQVLFSFIME